jgi:hypothetical protein
MFNALTTPVARKCAKGQRETVRSSSVAVRAIFSWGALFRSDPREPLPGSESARTHSPPARRPRWLPPSRPAPSMCLGPGRPRPATCPPSGSRPAGCLRFAARCNLRGCALLLGSARQGTQCFRLPVGPPSSYLGDSANSQGRTCTGKSHGIHGIRTDP